MTKRCLLGVLCFALGACAAGAGQSEPQPLPFEDTPEADTGVAGPKDLGPYVAARFASELKDPRAVDFYRHALRQDPDEPGLINTTFTLAVIEGDMATAVAMAERLAPLEQQHLMAQILYLVHQVKRGDERTALAVAAAIDSNFFQRSIGPLIKAWIHARDGDQEAALAEVETAALVRFNKHRAMAHEAFLLDYFGRDDEAEAAYQAVIDMPRGASADVVAAYGNLLLRQNQQQQAIDLYSRMKTTANDDRDLDRRLAAARDGRALPVRSVSPAGGVARPLMHVATDLSRNGSLRPGIIFARFAAYLDPDNHEAQLLLGHLLSREGRYEPALQAYEPVLQAAPEMANAARYGMAIALRESGRTEAAIAALRAHLDTEPDSPGTWVTLGDLHRQESGFDAAEAAYSQAIRLNEERGRDEWYPYFARAVAYEQTDRWPEAEADLKRAKAIKPDQADVLNYLGYSWIDRGVHLDKGMDLIEQALALEPGNGFIIDSMGWAHYLTGNYSEAVRFLEEAIVEEPGDATISDHLGDAYWQVGRHLEARYQWEHALRLSEKDAQRADLREKLTFGLTVARADKPDGR